VNFSGLCILGGKSGWLGGRVGADPRVGGRFFPKYNEKSVGDRPDREILLRVGAAVLSQLGAELTIAKKPLRSFNEGLRRIGRNDDSRAGQRRQTRRFILFRRRDNQGTPCTKIGQGL
jgi:hypothetical protein